MPARHRLGSLQLNILTDGVYFQDAGAVFGVVPRILWERLGIELNSRYQMALGLNSLLVSSQGKTVLIETGVGEKERPLGQTERPAGVSLPEELAAIGVAPADVDVVVTHPLGITSATMMSDSPRQPAVEMFVTVASPSISSDANPNMQRRLTLLAFLIFCSFSGLISKYS